MYPGSRIYRDIYLYLCFRFALENSRISSLYDSVAAELRAKLGKKNSPILLPLRDYDTVHRQKGNLTGNKAPKYKNNLKVLGCNYCFFFFRNWTKEMLKRKHSRPKCEKQEVRVVGRKFGNWFRSSSKSWKSGDSRFQVSYVGNA